ncbi:acyltransferase [Natronococcus wangiae]|uniref:acyltransferase n=1 Tax=Natronococcus wangiae TaxID=3068275 RepID=UPI00273D0498|nr:acyltransferase [Natronococcus sp. AD5]
MTDRIHSIDSLRAIAIFFVVVAHANPFKGMGAEGNAIYFVLDTIGQFDVPFFFMASGYFLATKLATNDPRSYIPATVRKLASIYVFGIVIYFPVLVAWTARGAVRAGDDVSGTLTARLLEAFSPIGLLYYGDSIAFHLWFLTALIFAICIIAAFVAADKTVYILPTAALFHAVGLVAENYPMIATIPLQTRDGLFFGFFYVALGFALRSSDWSPRTDRRWLYLVGLAVLVAVQFAERYAVGYLLSDATFSQSAFGTPYAVSTVFLTLALFAAALSYPTWTKGTPLPELGEYAVGVYILHVPVLRVLEMMSEAIAAVAGVSLQATIAWQLLITPVVFLTALGLYIRAGRIGLIDIGGSHTPWLDRLWNRVASEQTMAPSSAD